MDTTLVSALPSIIYPESDGKPVGETDVHRQEILDLIAALSEYFRADMQVYVSGNLMFYYEEGVPASVVAPDVFVVRGVPKRQRRTYKLWQEGVPPAIVLEISSRSTRLEDLGTKRALYAMLGVAEYVLFDPLGEYLVPALQGFRLVGGEYVRIEPEQDGALVSQALGMRLVPEGGRLALFEIDTGARVLRPHEEAAARRAEAAARRAAEDARRAEAAARRTAEDARQAEAAARQVAEARADALAAELERLRAELAWQRGENT